MKTITKDRRILKGETPEALRDMENEYGLSHIQENANTLKC